MRARLNSQTMHLFRALGSFNGIVTIAARKKLLIEISGTTKLLDSRNPSGKAAFKNLTLIFDGLEKMVHREQPSDEAIDAAEKFNLRFVLIDNVGHLSLAGEAVKLEEQRLAKIICKSDPGLEQNPCLIEANSADERIGKIMDDISPKKLGLSKTPFHKGERSFPMITKNFALSFVIDGGEFERGLYWTDPFLFRRLDWHSCRARSLPLGPERIPIATYMANEGFSKGITPIILDAYQPVPVAPLSPDYVPKGFVRVKSFGGGVYGFLAQNNGEMSTTKVVIRDNEALPLQGEPIAREPKLSFQPLFFDPVPDDAYSISGVERGTMIIMGLPQTWIITAEAQRLIIDPTRPPVIARVARFAVTPHTTLKEFEDKVRHLKDCWDAVSLT